MSHLLNKAKVQNFIPTFTRFIQQNDFLSARLASTKSFHPDKNNRKNKSGGYMKRPIKYVDVESPFSQNNKLYYAMPSEPHVASERLLNILEKGSFDDAHEYIKALPLDLQSNVVWNHLIGYCARQGKAQTAQKLFVQMRKRGKKPNEQTFTLMIKAYHQSVTPNSVEKAEDLIKKMKHFDMTPNVIHINNLMTVYNCAGYPQKTLKLLSDMTLRKMTPDVITYSTALKACSELENPSEASKEIQKIWKNIDNQLEKNMMGPSNNNIKIENLNLTIDDSLVISILTAISHTYKKDSDMIPGLEAINRLYSLCPPKVANIIERNRIFGMNQQYGFGVQPSVMALDSILRFCGKLGYYNLGKEYYELALHQYPRLKTDECIMNYYSWLKKKDKVEQKTRNE